MAPPPQVDREEARGRQDEEQEAAEKEQFPEEFREAILRPREGPVLACQALYRDFSCGKVCSTLIPQELHS